MKMENRDDFEKKIKKFPLTPFTNSNPSIIISA